MNAAPAQSPLIPPMSSPGALAAHRHRRAKAIIVRSVQFSVGVGERVGESNGAVPGETAGERDGESVGVIVGDDGERVGTREGEAVGSTVAMRSTDSSESTSASVSA
jgi:hypothetical protein